MGRLIELSHTIEDGLVTYRGLPAPIICDFLSREASEAHYDEGTSFHIGRFDMVASTGAYVDSPLPSSFRGQRKTRTPTISAPESVSSPTTRLIDGLR